MVFLRGDTAGAGPLENMRARYAGIVFAVTESDVVTLSGMDRFRVTLKPIRGQGSIKSDDMLMALCGSILSAKSALEERGFDRDRIFRISIQVQNEGQNLFDGAIPITVQGGACRPDIRASRYLLRYPAPISDYVLDFVEPVVGEEGNYELRFNHLSENPAVLSEFDFQTACKFVAQDKPELLAKYLNYDEINQLTVVAQSGWDVGILSTYRNLSVSFHWANGVCSPVETGAPT